MAKLSALRYWFAICLIVLLAGCGHARIVRRDYPIASAPPPRITATPAPVKRPVAPPPPTVASQPTTPLPLPASETYIVKAGDTLYGLARRFGLKFTDLVEWNRLSEPYAIQTGQRLHLRPSTTATVTASIQQPVKPTPTAPTANGNPSPSLNPESPGPVFQTVQTLPPNPTPSDSVVVAPPTASSTSPPVAAPQAPSPPTADTHVMTPSPNPAENTPATTDTVSPTIVTAAPPTQSAQPPSLQPPVAPSGKIFPGGPSWRWPTDGEIIGRYVAGDQTQQGIDIGGRSGQPVIAAADGVVVYSGAGLVGYGELVIIKHSEEWLSAYAHNRRRLVAEGTKVRSGEAIAEMGRTGAVSDMLHFEIRRNGKPVDPLLYLPKK